MTYSNPFLIMRNKRYFLVFLIVIFFFTVSYTLYYNDKLVNNVVDVDKGDKINKIIPSPSPSSCFDSTDFNEERYLTYLPHSGFHNQRNSLENAIFLSWVLNRTLIMPPILFSKKNYIPHKPYDILYNILRGNLTNNMIRCKKSGVESKSCLFTQLDWEELMNFKFIKKNIRYIHREDLNLDVKELYKFLNITNPDSQVFTLSEETRYDFQFYDDESITEVSDEQFKYLISLCSLQKRKEKLIHFGSVYHALRFNLKFKENIKFLRSVRKSMIINHHDLLNVGEKISEQLGGLGSYIGVHLRLGDNGLDRKFGEKAIENVDNITKKLLGEININNNISSLDEIEVKNDLVPTKTMKEYEKCLLSISPEQRQYPIVYLASDKPHSDSRLKKFFREFPCVFMLFTNFEKYLDPLKQVKNPRDGALLYRYFVPFIDGIVAARGIEFIGTPESTFSDYVIRLHENWVGPQN